eukprot:355066-Chlamydomonas_euryale.AAC.12
MPVRKVCNKVYSTAYSPRSSQSTALLDPLVFMKQCRCKILCALGGIRLLAFHVLQPAADDTHALGGSKYGCQAGGPAGLNLMSQNQEHRPNHSIH